MVTITIDVKHTLELPDNYRNMSEFNLIEELKQWYIDMIEEYEVYEELIDVHT